MALSKAKELRELSDEEISAEIAKIKRDLFDLRFQKATRQKETGFHEFRHTRRKLAQLMTIERERQLAGHAAEANASVVSTADTDAAEEA
ncbi:MAG: 50S ribosomal protein L29 [Phormidesmis sp.]